VLVQSHYRLAGRGLRALRCFRAGRCGASPKHSRERKSPCQSRCALPRAARRTIQWDFHYCVRLAHGRKIGVGLKPEAGAVPALCMEDQPRVRHQIGNWQNEGKLYSSCGHSPCTAKEKSRPAHCRSGARPMRWRSPGISPGVPGENKCEIDLSQEFRINTID